jgi:hypothetical protein
MSFNKQPLPYTWGGRGEIFISVWIQNFHIVFIIMLNFNCHFKGVIKSYC